MQRNQDRDDRRARRERHTDDDRYAMAPDDDYRRENEDDDTDSDDGRRAMGDYGFGQYGGGGQSFGRFRPYDRDNDSRGGDYSGRQSGDDSRYGDRGENDSRSGAKYGGQYGSGMYGRQRQDNSQWGAGYGASPDYGARRTGYDQQGFRQARYGAGYGDAENSGQSYRGAGQTPFGTGASAFGTGPHTGRGPKGYTRSDDRIREDANDRLTAHGHVDATEVEVTVKNGEVTLSGTVEDREARRAAEDSVQDIPGVSHVQNNIRVKAAKPTASTAGKSASSMAGDDDTDMAGKRKN